MGLGGDSDQATTSFVETDPSNAIQSAIHASTSIGDPKRSTAAISNKDTPLSSSTQQINVERISATAEKLRSYEGEDSISSASVAVHYDSGEMSPGSDRDGADEDRSEGPSKSTIEKSSLRKGKWVVEEEEYTSRVIQHFSAGLLRLPEGATLRSYLAEKLSCDPMRITKKFTGACCLGRRVYHLRDRPRATQAELEMAQLERDHLEQRFRVRIEHELSGLPLSRRHDLILAQHSSHVGSVFPMQNLSAASTLSPWLHSCGSGIGGGISNTLGLAGASNALGLSGTSNSFAPSTLGSTGASPAAFLASAHQLLPGGAYASAPRFLIPGQTDGPQSNQSDHSLQLLSNLVASWAVAHAAVSLPSSTLSSLSTTPATPLPAPMPSKKLSDSSTPIGGPDFQWQLKSVYEVQRMEEEQRQLRAAYEEQKGKARHASAADKKAGNQQSALRGEGRDNALSRSSASLSVPTSSDNMLTPAERLKMSYEAHLQSLKQDSWKTVSGQQGVCKPNKPIVATGDKDDRGPEKSMDDEEAGTVLLGFLNSLRQSYEDAVEKKAIDSSEIRFKNDGMISIVKKPTAASFEEKPSQATRRPLEVDMTPDDARADQKVQEHYSELHTSEESRGRNLSTAVSQFMSSNAGRRRPASVTDVSSGNSSSQPTEVSSSLEDSSDKTEPSDDSSDKSDQSSSEEEKYEIDEEPPTRSNKGPPRKRLKGAFTKENLMVHSRRMSEGNNYN